MTAEEGLAQITDNIATLSVLFDSYIKSMPANKRKGEMAIFLHRIGEELFRNSNEGRMLLAKVRQEAT
jgi:hypothetical protein